MIVEKIDGDSDGFVTEVELRAWIKKAQKKYIYENVDRQWKDFDVNNDGMISWEEYRNVTYGTYLGKKGMTCACMSPGHAICPKQMLVLVMTNSTDSIVARPLVLVSLIG